MSEIDCGETPDGLAGLPKFRAALAAWMREFDRCKATPFGPIEASIAVGVRRIRLVLALTGVQVSRSWPTGMERKYKPRAIEEAILGVAEGARLELVFRVATGGKRA